MSGTLGTRTPGATLLLHAWADSRGIWTGSVDDLSGSECQLTRKLVIPGGASPDWGPKEWTS